MKYFAVFAFLLLSCCADVDTRSLLSMNFEEVEDRSITSRFRQSDRPGYVEAVRGTSAFSNTASDAPLSVQDGRLIVRDTPFTFDESDARFYPFFGQEDRYSYFLTGEIEEANQGSDEPSSIRLSFQIPRPPRQPFTVAVLTLRTVNTESGVRMVSVRDERTDTEIALTPLNQPFALIVTFDVASREYSVSVPSASSTNSTAGDFMNIGTSTIRTAPWLTVSPFSRSVISLKVKSLDVSGLRDVM